MRDLYLRFATWLHQNQPASPSLLRKFMSHHSFFERIDAQFVEVGDLTAAELLGVYGPAELRKHLLVMRFLETTLGLTFTEQEKQDSADKERIAAKLADSSRHPWGAVIRDYAAVLAVSDVTVRTQRMYVSTAEAFCNAVMFDGDAPWSEQDAQRFLKRKPGTRANLVRFVSFCRGKYNWSVVLPSSSLSKSASKPPRTIRELKKLLKEVKAVGVENAQAGTLAKVIAKSFGTRIGTILALSPEQISGGEGNLVLSINGESIDVPMELEEIVRSYAARLALSANG